jgi:hypothetical protein
MLLQWTAPIFGGAKIMSFAFDPIPPPVVIREVRVPQQHVDPSIMDDLANQPEFRRMCDREMVHIEHCFNR